MDSPIAALIATADRGDPAAAKTLFAALYAELRRLARRELARRGGAASVGATSLLHEVYLDMAAREGRAFPDKARFMSYAARVMRGLIIDHARGQFEITALRTDMADQVVDAGELTQIGEALDALAGKEPTLAEVVDLKFFCGFSFAEIAAMRGVSERTIQRQWQKGRLYLHRALRRPAAN